MSKKRSFICVLLAAMMVLSGCGSKNKNTHVDSAETQEQVSQGRASQVQEITLWTFPVGTLGDLTSMSGLIAGFQREYPDIQVKVECLTYDDGDEKIRQAIQNGTAPDLVFEGPERLVADWGAKGYLVDLSELWDSKAADGIYENIRKACQHSNGAYYEFPVCMTAHCMAINYNLFKEAGALQYIDEENHSWTTEDFIKAVDTLSNYTQKRAGVIYCKSQSGDQGTRALVNNLYGGTFTDENHSVYTVDSEENKQALKLLTELKGIEFEPDMTSGDEIAQFCRGELAMAFCWNASVEINQIVNNPELDFDVFPMTFPVSAGEPKLQGGIWGFGIFDNKDEGRIQAAKTFIRYMTENDSSYKRAVLASSFWPVRDMPAIYENDLLMTEYSMFMQYMGDYYQVTPGWVEARAEWWKMLQKIGAGEEIDEAVAEFSRQVNK